MTSEPVPDHDTVCALITASLSGTREPPGEPPGVPLGRFPGTTLGTSRWFPGYQQSGTPSRARALPKDLKQNQDPSNNAKAVQALAKKAGSKGRREQAIRHAHDDDHPVASLPRARHDHHVDTILDLIADHADHGTRTILAALTPRAPEHAIARTIEALRTTTTITNRARYAVHVLRAETRNRPST